MPNVAPVPPTAPDFDALAAGFEERRVRAIRATRKRTVPAAAGVAVICVLVVVIAAQAQSWWPLVGAPPAAFGAWQWRGQPQRAYLRTVKDEAFPAAIKMIGPGWRFARRGGLDLRALKPFGILPGYDKAEQQDLIAGRWAGCGVEIVEAKLTERRSTGKSTQTVTVFKGVIVRFTLPRSVGARIVVRRRFEMMSFFSDLARVKLETSGFEKRFNVYADDQVAARVLLTVTVMERLLALSEDLRRLGGGVPAERLEASAMGDQLLVMVPCNANLFEARGEDEAGHVARDIERLLAEVRDVLRLAEALGVAV